MRHVEDTFISHLIELRDRLLRSLIAVGVVMAVLAIWPGIGAVYDLLARPMMQSLPEGTKMIATGVVSPISDAAQGRRCWRRSCWRCRTCSTRRGHSSRPASTPTRSASLLPLVVSEHDSLPAGRGVLLLLRVRDGLPTPSTAIAPTSITPAPDIEDYLNFVITMFLAFGVTFEIPLAHDRARAHGRGDAGKAEARCAPTSSSARSSIAAVVTPPDVLSQLLLAIPMCLLYEVGIIAARYRRQAQAARRRRSATDAERSATDRIEVRTTKDAD